MRSLVIALTVCFSTVTFAAMGSSVRFAAEVTSFDKKWVHIVTDTKKNFQIPRGKFEASNGPTRSGKLMVQLDTVDFANMKALSRLTKIKK
ncbi:MAG: hypothetical protein J7501_02425 [Bdellovibrio sp.]|nr:hypothetical protein [Bdellovibrio sp.]